MLGVSVKKKIEYLRDGSLSLISAVDRKMERVIRRHYRFYDTCKPVQVTRQE